MVSPSEVSPSELCPPDLVHRLRLHLATLYHGGLAQRLLERFGVPEEVFRQRPSVLRASAGASRGALERLRDPTLEKLANDELRRAADTGVRLLCQGQEGYPERFYGLDAMPLVLYVQGAPEALAGESSGGPLVGIVGSRRPTPYGLRQGGRFASALARRGFTVVSGLAAGIDGQAHRMSLEAGGCTVAVLGSGLERVYPREHEALVGEILRSGHGAVISEFPFRTPPRSFHFPMRNRIISGLSDAVLVVEAGERSGSLITARYALDQGRTIYVVPGRIGPEAIGGLRLLVDGAVPALEVDDILPGIVVPGNSPPGAGSPEDSADAVLDGPFGPLLEELFREEDAWYPDNLAVRLEAPVPQILAELGRLELDGLLERMPGGAYIRRVGWRKNVT